MPVLNRSDQRAGGHLARGDPGQQGDSQTLLNGLLDYFEAAYFDTGGQREAACHKSLLDRAPKHGGGQVINTASISGLRASGGSSLAYSVSKAGTIHLTRCLATALAPDIRVNAVAPGLLATRWNANFTSVQLDAATRQAPLKKITDLEDTAAVYVMLARNESITGQLITVDAGITL
jgi:NAD(P)-dependent dehydrogenase (short-subunit alcohol dehydrogenase family)